MPQQTRRWTRSAPSTGVRREDAGRIVGRRSSPGVVNDCDGVGTLPATNPLGSALRADRCYPKSPGQTGPLLSGQVSGNVRPSHALNLLRAADPEGRVPRRGVSDLHRVLISGSCLFMSLSSGGVATSFGPAAGEGSRPWSLRTGSACRRLAIRRWRVLGAGHTN
jgi:hypothetical protein